jgi:O-antigen/teichoic acid export membrane protein
MRRFPKAGQTEDAQRNPWSSRLVQNAVALMISSVGSAILGVAFWGTAAHLATATAVGRMSAEITAMILLATLAQLSFGTIFERFLPVAGAETKRFVLRAYVMCVTCGLVVTSIYAFSGLAHSYLPSAFVWRALFVVAVVLWTIFALQDSVLIGLRASRWVPLENILFGAMKLALLPILIATSPDQGIFLAWTIPVIVTLIAVNWYIFRKRIPEHMLKAQTESLPQSKELIVLAGAQYATLLYSTITPALVTLIVIQRLGAVANAHYFIPGLITGSLSVFLLSVYKSFVVEAASEPHALRHHTNMAIGTMSAVTVPSVLIGVIFAPFILRLVGSTYATHNTITLLRMLLLSLPLSAVSIFYSAFAWLDRRVWWLAVRDVISVAVFFGVLFSLIDRHGILAIGVASLVTSGLQGVFFLPISIRRYRLTTNDESHERQEPAAS